MLVESVADSGTVVSGPVFLLALSARSKWVMTMVPNSFSTKLVSACVDRQSLWRFVCAILCASIQICGPQNLNGQEIEAQVTLLPEFPGEKSQWNGFVRHDFEVEGRSVLVVSPAKPAPGLPWVWHGEFFGHKPAPDIELLKQGFHIAYMRVPNLLGAPKAVKYWNSFYQKLTQEYGLSKKVALVGLSRGGLYCYNWAAENPQHVACIYGDAPVCDFKSWPGGQGDGKGSRRDWDLVLKEYDFKTETAANAYMGNPVDTLSDLAIAGVPLLHVFGDQDKVVPWEENTAVIATRYRALGGQIQLIQKPGVGHHPHGLEDTKPIVDFIVRHTLENPPPLIRKKQMDPVDLRSVEQEPSKLVVYQTVAADNQAPGQGNRELLLHVFEPEGWAEGQKRPCFVAIHGGGWTGGEPRRMYPFASHFAKKGMVGISVQYRLLNALLGTTVFDSVRDVRSAIRFLKTHHQELGIDADQLVVSGASAGGHLAAATAMFGDVNATDDSLEVDPVPHSLILLFPVIDTSDQGYGQKKIGEDWKSLSPLHQVKPGIPHALIFHGNADNVTPFSGAKAFVRAMSQAGNKCELIEHEGGRHGYLMFDDSLFEQTLVRMEAFLTSRGILRSER